MKVAELGTGSRPARDSRRQKQQASHQEVVTDEVFKDRGMMGMCVKGKSTHVCPLGWEEALKAVFSLSEGRFWWRWGSRGIRRSSTVPTADRLWLTPVLWKKTTPSTVNTATKSSLLPPAAAARPRSWG